MPVHRLIHLDPCPSPDGQQVAFSMQGADGTMQIGLTSLDGLKIRQLTRTGDMNTRTEFSPDGRSLACVRGSPPNVSLIVVNVQTGEETLVAHDALSIRPVWRTTGAR